MAALRIKGVIAGHLISSLDYESNLRSNQQQAQSIVNWLVHHCNAETIYFLWDEMKKADERYLLEGNTIRLLRRLSEEEEREEREGEDET